MRLALYQPDIPQNTGTILRTAACLGVPVDIIGPAGFDLSDRAFRRAGLDYLRAAIVERHLSFASFLAVTRTANRRLLLLSTKATTPHLEFRFEANDVLMLGRESSGVPDEVHDTAAARIVIPLVGGQRSLNIAVAAAIGLAEALRQTGGFPASAAAVAPP